MTRDERLAELVDDWWAISARLVRVLRHDESAPVLSMAARNAIKKEADCLSAHADQLAAILREPADSCLEHEGSKEMAITTVAELRTKWRHEMDLYRLGAACPVYDPSLSVVRARNQASAETCRRFLADVDGVLAQERSRDDRLAADCDRA